MNCHKIAVIVLLGICGSAIAKPQPLTWDEVGNTMNDWGTKINEFGRKAAAAAKGMCQFANSMPQYPVYPSYPNYPPSYYPNQDPRFHYQPNQPWGSGPAFNVPSFPTNGPSFPSIGNNKPINPVNKPIDGKSGNKPRAFAPPYIPPVEEGSSNDIPTFINKPISPEQDDMNKVDSPAEVNQIFKRRTAW